VIYTLAGGDRGHYQNFGFSPCLLGLELCVEDKTRGYRGGGAIGGTKHGGDTRYWYVPHLNSLWVQLVLAHMGFVCGYFKIFIT